MEAESQVIRAATAGAVAGLYVAVTRWAFSSPSTRFQMSFEDLQTSRHYPKWLVEPGWTATAASFLVAAMSALVYTAEHAHEARELALEGMPTASPPLPGTWLWLAHFAMVVHGLAVNFNISSTFGSWVFLSFTVTSWNLIILHSALHVLMAWIPACAELAALVRFPMVTFNTVTFVIWWLVLFPGGVLLLKGVQRARFLRLQVMYSLLNVHMFNFGFAVLFGVWLTPVGRQAFHLHDLWIAVLAALVYLVFYLAFLERNGIHFYIILSPRTRLCVFVYSGLLGLIASIWKGANHTIATMT